MVLKLLQPADNEVGNIPLSGVKALMKIIIHI